MQILLNTNQVLECVANEITYNPILKYGTTTWKERLKVRKDAEH